MNLYEREWISYYGEAYSVHNSNIVTTNDRSFPKAIYLVDFPLYDMQDPFILAKVKTGLG